MNDKIVLSEIKKKDLELLKKWRNNPRILKFNTQYFLLNMEHQKRWFDEIKDNFDPKVDSISFLLLNVFLWFLSTFSLINDEKLLL